VQGKTEKGKAMKPKKITYQDLVNEGLADSVEEVKMMLKDMGITLADINKGKWY
jgi:hypothetical protein